MKLSKNYLHCTLFSDHVEFNSKEAAGQDGESDQG